MAEEAVLPIESAYKTLAVEIDDQTSFHSAHPSAVCLSWHLLESIAVQNADFVSRCLIKDIESEFCWWRVSMVNMLAHETLGITIHYDKEIFGRADPVRARLLEWWVEEGAVAFEGLRNDSSS